MNRLVRKLSEFSPELTIHQLIQLLEKENDTKIKDEQIIIDKIKNKYRNSYLKSYTEDSLFGEEVSIFHIDEVISNERSTDWELLYSVSGVKITISKNHIFRNSINQLFSEKSLKSMDIISLNEYKFYENAYHEINGVTETILKLK